jgi:hypothetical protein
MQPSIIIEFTDDEVEKLYLTISETLVWLENLALQAINTDIDSEPLRKLCSKFSKAATGKGHETFSRTHSKDMPV